MVKQYKGFTVIELLIVMAIIAIMSIILMPDVLQWRANALFRGDAFNARADLARAKSLAIRSGSQNVGVHFEGDTSIIFRDSSSPGEYKIGEPIVSSRKTNAGEFDKKDIVFNSRGMAVTSGTVKLTEKSRELTITVSMLGSIGM